VKETEMYDDQEIGAELRRLAAADPLDPISSTSLLERGRRSRRRRKVFSIGGVVAAVAAVAVSAAVLPGLRSEHVKDHGQVATTPTPTKTRVNPGLFTPLPGVPSGDAALGQLTKKEADRRCVLRDGQGGNMRNLSYRAGSTVLYVDAQGMPGTGRRCTVPGDSRPTTAVIAKAKADPMPADAAGQLRNCSVLLWHDLTTWKVVTSDTAKGAGISLIALSPSGRYAVRCQLAPTFNAAVSLGSGPGITAATDVRDNLDHFASAGSQVCPGTPCLGWHYLDGGRVSSDIARIRIQAKWGGQHHDLTVTDGWYALSWINGDPQGRMDATITAYDKNGKLFKRVPS
jgi:hypothetical protein